MNEGNGVRVCTRDKHCRDCYCGINEMQFRSNHLHVRPLRYFIRSALWRNVTKRRFIHPLTHNRLWDIPLSFFHFNCYR